MNSPLTFPDFTSVSVLFNLILWVCVFNYEIKFDLHTTILIPPGLGVTGKCWLFHVRNIITLGTIVFSKSLKSLFPLSANCRYAVHTVHQHRPDSLNAQGGKCVCCNYPVFLLDLSTLSPQLQKVQHNSDCLKATNLCPSYHLIAKSATFEQK